MRNTLMGSKKISKELIMLLILIITPLIDIIYSITQHIYNINIPVHLLIRGAVLLYILVSIRNIKHIAYLLVLCSGLFLGIVWVKIAGYPFSLIDNVSYSMKLVNLFASVFYFKESIDNKNVEIIKLLNYINISTLTIGVSIVLSNIFRFGFKTYLDKEISGYKGFFMVHNSITAVLLMVIPISFFLFYKNKNKFNGIILISNILAILLIGTKSGAIGLAMIVMMIMVAIIIDSNIYIKIKNIKRLPIIISILVGISIIYPFASNFINEQTKEYKRNGYDDIYSYMVSNRNLQIKYINKEIKENLTLNPKYFFGMGVKYANDVIHKGKKEFEIIEMDFEGVKIYSGYAVLFLVLLLILKIFIELILSLNSKENLLAKLIVLISIIMGLIHATFGGHVIYEGISGIYFGGILGIAMYLSNNVNIVNFIKDKKSKV